MPDVGQQARDLRQSVPKAALPLLLPALCTDSHLTALVRQNYLISA